MAWSRDLYTATGEEGVTAGEDLVNDWTADQVRPWFSSHAPARARTTCPRDTVGCTPSRRLVHDRGVDGRGERRLVVDLDPVGLGRLVARLRRRRRPVGVVVVLPAERDLSWRSGRTTRACRSAGDAFRNARCPGSVTCDSGSGPQSAGRQARPDVPVVRATDLVSGSWARSSEPALEHCVRGPWRSWISVVVKSSSCA